LYISPFMYMHIFGPRALISIQMLFITCIHSRLVWFSLQSDRVLHFVVVGFLSALSQQCMLLEDEGAFGCVAWTPLLPLARSHRRYRLWQQLSPLEATRAVLSPSYRSHVVAATEWIVRLLPSIDWIRPPCYLELCRRPPLPSLRLDWEPVAFDSMD
jgi:hypothetical protein